MASERKSNDIVLPEVQKPAGFGTLVSVVNLGEGKRELWFQHASDPSIIRAVEVDVASGSSEKPLTIKTTGARDRSQLF